MHKLSMKLFFAWRSFCTYFMKLSFGISIQIKFSKLYIFPPALPQPTFFSPHFDHKTLATIFNQAHSFNL
jgi:hypothetical protein